MEPTKELIDAVYRDKVTAAREQTPAERFLSGPQLFDWACEIMRAGIRAQHPAADEDRVSQLLRERLVLGRRLQEMS